MASDLSNSDSSHELLGGGAGSKFTPGPPRLPPRLPAKPGAKSAEPEVTPETEPEPADEPEVSQAEPEQPKTKKKTKKSGDKSAASADKGKSSKSEEADTEAKDSKTKGSKAKDDKTQAAKGKKSKPARDKKSKEETEDEEQDTADEPGSLLSPVGIFSEAKYWIKTQGLYWSASTVIHAMILAIALLLMGSVSATKINSVAPVFAPAAGIDTVIGAPPDLDSFDMQNVRVDPANLNTSDTAAIDAPSNVCAGGDVAGTESGAAGGGGGAGGASSMSMGVVGTGGGGGGGGGIGGLGGIAGMDLRSAIPSFGHGSKLGQGGGRRRSSAALGGVVGAGDVGGAVDGLLGGIQRELQDGDLLVVWLIDGSISLIDDRQKVAERVEPFFSMIERRGAGHFKLHNAVVAFGQTIVPVVPPTAFGPKIAQAIRELPVDGSGLENVMTSVDQVMELYGKTWKGGMMIVVWTDESGDDILRLEETIYACRRRNAVVNVVGPTAVLGSEGGRHHYVAKETGQAFLLPIKRGPDTCLPERIFMPYWWDSPLAPWINRGIVAAHGVPWYGGPHREGVLSGVGPYALTRLALETGGQFILLDRKEDQSPFKIETMKRYLPDYKSAAEYVKDIGKSPLRKATSAAVQATYTVTNLWPPSTAFILHRDEDYPFAIRAAGYRTPPQFRELLKEELPKQLAHATAAAESIEQALKQFPDAGMESEYAAERSPRWRAWYDLTRGRLLAMSIRTLEYKMACEMIWQPGVLHEDTNRMSFHPSKEYLSGTVSESRAREALRLLTRCKTENAGTPWELLANWELKHELGISIKQIAVPPPKPSPPSKAKPSPPRPPKPVIKFPNL